MEKREEPALGVRFLTPAGWHRTDMSNRTNVIVFSPSETDNSTRISLLQFPVSAMPAGLETREAGIQKALGTSYRRVRLESATVVRRPGTLLEYTTQIPLPVRTIEYGLRAGNKFYIFQFVARWRHGRAWLAPSTPRSRVSSCSTPRSRPTKPRRWLRCATAFASTRTSCCLPIRSFACRLC